MRNEYEYEVTFHEMQDRGVEAVTVEGFDGDSGVSLTYEIQGYSAERDNGGDGELLQSSLWRVTVDESQEYEAAVYQRTTGQEISGHLPAFLLKPTNALKAFLGTQWIDIIKLPWTAFYDAEEY